VRSRAPLVSMAENNGIIPAAFKNLYIGVLEFKQKYFKKPMLLSGNFARSKA
jgi:hypothetical protein